LQALVAILLREARASQSVSGCSCWWELAIIRLSTKIQITPGMPPTKSSPPPNWVNEPSANSGIALARSTIVLTNHARINQRGKIVARYAASETLKTKALKGNFVSSIAALPASVSARTT
jgi:hypothetical protein